MRYIYTGTIIAKVTSGNTQYLLADRLSVGVILDSAGNVIGRQGHLPFGEDFGESGTQEKHHFTSYERDGESGLDFNSRICLASAEMAGVILQQACQHA